MAKSNYGVTSLGGGTSIGSSTGVGGSSGGSGSGKNYFQIDKTFAKGGFLPHAFERGSSTKQGNSVKSSVKSIAEAYSTSENNIAADFRKSLKKKG